MGVTRKVRGPAAPKRKPQVPTNKTEGENAENSWLRILSAGTASAAAPARRESAIPEPSAEEVTVLDADESDQLAAIAFLAILAYPKRSEWRKRDQFVTAAKALHVKAAMDNGYDREKLSKQYREYPRSKIAAGPISAAWRRIVQRRLAAVEIFRTSVLSKAGFGVRFSGKRVTGVTSAASAVATALKKTDANKVLARAWVPSLPVLHLALAFDDFALSTPGLKELKRPDFRLLLDPRWVRSAIEDAEKGRESVRLMALKLKPDATDCCRVRLTYRKSSV